MQKNPSLFKTSCKVFLNSSTALLYEEAIKRNEGKLTQGGALSVDTGRHTARAVADRFIVKEPSSESNIWWGKINRPFASDKFFGLHQRLMKHLQSRDIFVQDCCCGADPQYQLPLRVISENAWHSLFARNMFLRPKHYDVQTFAPELTVLHAPSFQASPQNDGTQSEAFIILNLAERLILIGGTAYAGEIKKSVFSVMNYLLPEKGVLPMHCSANVGEQEDSDLFFGLSGTGKTTLSADPKRRLIGDDEHGWSDSGIFNFEGGCYAKVIRLSKEAEPDIWQCTRRYGTILENVVYHPERRQLDLDSDAITENTRASYPLTHIDGALHEGLGPHPKNLILLTCDSFGVMPPVAKLSAEATMYYFISGYTAKVGGTEVGLGKEPQATFSPCFGAPFMPRHPSVYAELLRTKINRYAADCWLVNTGWSGGGYGIGKRMPIHYTRKIIDAIHSGALAKVPTATDTTFGFEIPQSCPEVPEEILNPRQNWPDQAAYENKSRELACKFQQHFETFAAQMGKDVMAAGPQVRKSSP